jgi:hypothetical protein
LPDWFKCLGCARGSAKSQPIAHADYLHHHAFIDDTDSHSDADPESNREPHADRNADSIAVAQPCWLIQLKLELFSRSIANCNSFFFATALRHGFKSHPEPYTASEP